MSNSSRSESLTTSTLSVNSLDPSVALGSLELLPKQLDEELNFPVGGAG